MSSVQGRTNWCPEEGRLLTDSTERKRWVWFGISPTKWAEMAENGCEICGSMVGLVLDHNHDKPLVYSARGAICNRHNVIVGHHEAGKQRTDDPEVIAYIAKYA